MSIKLTPIEILCEIFHLLCEEPIALYVLDNKTHFEEFPWAVGQVCRRWRGAFLSHPPLWTSLSLYYFNHKFHNSESLDPDSFAEMNRRTVLYIERSRQLPLVISVCITASPRDERVQYFPRAVWRSLISCSNRWRKADLVLGNEICLLEDLLECRSKLSILESLALDIYHDYEAPGNTFDNPFTVLPRLTDLKISYCTVNPNWDFPWSQLTKMEIKMLYLWVFPGTELVALLSQLQNVEALTLFGTCDGHDPLLTPIQLARVRFLNISLGRHPYMFKWLETPLLEHLSVYDTEKEINSSDKWSVEMSSFVNRLSYRIRRLTLRSCRNVMAYIIMRPLFTVEHLCLNKQPPGSSPMLIRRISDFDCVYLPNLQELQVICCPLQANEGLMMAISYLLEARSRESKLVLVDHKVVPIQRVVIELHWDDHEWEEYYMRCCRLVNHSPVLGTIDNELERVGNWPINADIRVNKSLSQITIEPRS